MRPRTLIRLASFFAVPILTTAALPAGDEVFSPAHLIAHRGASALRPENTLAAVRYGIESGATVVEVDVRTTKDGVLVALHDETIDRTTSGTGRAGDKTLAEIRQYDAGAWFDPRYASERVPTLAEIFAACRNRADVLLDLKETGAEFLERVVREVRASGYSDRTIIGVRNVGQAKRFRELLPKSWQIGLPATPGEIRDFADANVEFLRLWPQWLSDKKLVENTRELGVWIHINGSDGSPEEIARLAQHRPDSISSDDPVRARSSLARFNTNVRRIRPYSKNGFYWQHDGRPTLLAGGTDDDNLFQWPDEKLRRQLALLQRFGGNYIRNTMSDRPDKGFEVYPYHRLENGRYDLERWNDEYWRRFATLLRLTAEKKIIVQIEIWDRFDYSREPWKVHPYNPANNVNYDSESATLAKDYPKHPGANVQPFFFTTPKQRDNSPLLRYQRRYVDKLLDISLRHNHVLYCIDNETSGEAAWAKYWARYVRERAASEDVEVAITQMWDDWNLRGPQHRRTIDNRELYDFIDVSQNNHQKGQTHWDNFQWVRRRIEDVARPINTVKTYGASGNKFGHSDQDGVERFWRHVLGGAASARFHRPDSGLGLSKLAQQHLRSLRQVEAFVDFWDLEPAEKLLDKRTANEAYAAAKKGESYVVYFPAGGEVRLDLRKAPKKLELTWIDLRTASGTGGELEGDRRVRLTPPDDRGWIVVIRASEAP